jgi:hypothetical protein
LHHDVRQAVQCHSTAAAAASAAAAAGHLTNQYLRIIHHSQLHVLHNHLQLGCQQVAGLLKFNAADSAHNLLLTNTANPKATITELGQLNPALNRTLWFGTST